MSLLGLLSKLRASDAERYIYDRIPNERVKGATPSDEPLREGRDYCRLTLCEMYLANDRKWFTTWYPAVHSLVRLQFGSKVVELPHISGPLDLQGVTSGNLENALQLNHQLTGLLPYNGGVLELRAGLLAMQGENYLPRFISVLSKFSALLAVPQLSAALEVAGPVATGIQDLLVGTDGELALGLHQAFASSDGGGANAPVPGYFVAVLATEDELPKGELSVDRDQLYRTQPGSPTRPLTGYTYMLFRLDRLSERDDIEGLTELVEPFNAAVDAVLTDDAPERAESLARMGAARSLQSPDLTRADRLRVARVLKERYDMAVGLGQGAVETELPPILNMLRESRATDRDVSDLDLALEYRELFP